MMQARQNVLQRVVGGRAVDVAGALILEYRDRHLCILLLMELHALASVCKAELVVLQSLKCGSMWT